MNATCPRCGTTYRVDPAKIPEGGVRARCTRCESVFRIEAPPAPDATEMAETAAAAEASGTAPEQAAPRPPESPAPQPFGASDPDRQARRLARALVSDIVVYHPDRRERSLAAGTLRQEFREEIRKSWDEYVSRVGEAVARQTPYFREALNEILAGGSSIF